MASSSAGDNFTLIIDPHSILTSRFSFHSGANDMLRLRVNIRIATFSA